MDDVFEVSCQYQNLSEKDSKVFPLLLFSSFLRRHSGLRSLSMQSCVLSSVEEHGNRCSAVNVANWCHTKFCCFIRWCHIGQHKRTGKKEIAGGMIGRSRNLQPNRESTGKFPTCNVVSVLGEVLE